MPAYGIVNSSNMLENIIRADSLEDITQMFPNHLCVEINIRESVANGFIHHTNGRTVWNGTEFINLDI